MGFNVASAGDFNGDGFDDVVVGVGGYDDPGDPANQSHGRAFIWFGSPNGLLEFTFYEHTDCLIDGALPGDSFGLTMAGVGDVDGDDLDDVAISAWYYAEPEEREGIVYGFKGMPVNFADDFESEDTLRWTQTEN